MTPELWWTAAAVGAVTVLLLAMACCWAGGLSDWHLDVLTGELADVDEVSGVYWDAVLVEALSRGRRTMDDPDALTAMLVAWRDEARGADR